MAAIVRYDRVPYPKPVSLKNGVATPMEAGQIVGIKALEGRELNVVGTAAEGDVLVMVAPSILHYDERLSEEDFVLKQGEICRGYLLESGDQHTVAKSLYGAKVVGDKITVAAKEVAVVREVCLYEGQESYLIEII